MMRRLWIVPLLVLCAWCTGCGSHRGGQVQLTSTNGKVFTTTFQRAYVATTGPGEYDIVLLDSAGDDDYRPPKKGQPLMPMPIAPMTQAMHIHTHWAALHGTTKNPAAINCSIDWYVLGSDGAGGDLITYEGAGLVYVEESGTSRQITIRDGQLRPKLVRGGMSDPVGEARISGSAKALYNDARVRDALAEVRVQQQPGAPGSR